MAVGWMMYDIFFSYKGIKVLIRTERMIDGVLIETNVKKKLVGRIKRQDGVDKLFLPKFLSKMPIEVPSDIHLKATDASVPVVRLLQRGDGLFQPVKGKVTWTVEDIDGKQQDLVKLKDVIYDREMTQWAINEERSAEERNKSVKKNDWKPVIIIASALIISAVVVIAGFNLAKGVYEDSVNEGRQDITETKDYLNKVLNILGNDVPTSSSNAQTNSTRPPVGTDTGG